MTFVGIDPGKLGAIAAVDGEGRHIYSTVMPVIKGGKNTQIDCREFLGIIRNYDTKDMVVAIEKVHAMPGQGVTSMFSFGETCGLLRGMLAALGVRVLRPTPQQWKKVMLEGTAKDKVAAIEACHQRWPSLSLKATPRCKKDHDGIAEALLLAEYARRTA